MKVDPSTARKAPPPAKAAPPPPSRGKAKPAKAGKKVRKIKPRKPLPSWIPGVATVFAIIGLWAAVAYFVNHGNEGSYPGKESEVLAADEDWEETMEQQLVQPEGSMMEMAMNGMPASPSAEPEPDMNEMKPKVNPMAAFKPEAQPPGPMQTPGKAGATAKSQAPLATQAVVSTMDALNQTLQNVLKMETSPTPTPIAPDPEPAQKEQIPTKPEPKMESADPQPQPLLNGRRMESWTLEISDVHPHSGPVRGELKGIEFSPDVILWNNKELVFRTGSEKAPEAEIKVTKLLYGDENLQDLEKTIQRANGSYQPVISLRWKDPKVFGIQSQHFFQQYSLIVQIDSLSTQSVAGSIYFAAPDSQKSFLSGTFKAVIP